MLHAQIQTALVLSLFLYTLFQYDSSEYQRESNCFSTRLTYDVKPCQSFQEPVEASAKGYWSARSFDKEVILDASTLGDIPAVYRVPKPAPHELPVIGVYIDPRVRTGFRYKVRPMQVRRVI